MENNSSDLNLSLGRFIALEREKLNYKKCEFAKLVGVGPDSLKYWEDNRFVPAGKNMRKLINLFGMTKSQVKHYFGTDLYGKA